MHTEIETPRLNLHPPRNEDAAEIARLADNRRIAVMLARLPSPYTQDDARAFIDWVNARPESEVVFGLYRKSEPQRLIGICGYNSRDRDEPDLGYWLGEPYWGRGYMSEAASAVTAHAFTHAGNRLLHSGCRIPNLASRRILEKIGFERVGLGHIFSRACGMNVPVHRFVLTKERWEGLGS